MNVFSFFCLCMAGTGFSHNVSPLFKLLSYARIEATATVVIIKQGTDNVLRPGKTTRQSLALC